MLPQQHPLLADLYPPQDACKRRSYNTDLQGFCWGRWMFLLIVDAHPWRIDNCGKMEIGTILEPAASGWCRYERDLRWFYACSR